MTEPQNRRSPGVAHAIAMNPVPMFGFVALYALWAVTQGARRGGNLAAQLTNTPTVEGYDGIGAGFAIPLILDGGPNTLWYETPSLALWAAIVSVSALFLSPLAAALWLLRRGLNGEPGFGQADEFTNFTKRHRDSQANRLHAGPGLGHPTTNHSGLALGTLDGQHLYMGPEDVAVTYMGPRAGKSTSLAIPTVLAAPGAVVATSNKSDLVAATQAARQRIGSRTWIFDPSRIVHEPPTWWWDPLEDLTGIDDAMRLAAVFVPKQPDDRNRFFTDSARDYLAGLLLAAALSNDHTIADVSSWLYENSDPTPVNILRQHRRIVEADALAAYIAGGDPETLANIYSSARAYTQSLKSATNLAWITPTPGRPGFNINQFLTNHETLYLLSREGELSSAPIVAAFTERILRTAEALATTKPSGRLNPFLTVVLDEAANIVKIGELPDLYSHYGSRGILVNSIFQNYAQPEAVWGKVGARKLWAAATVKLIGAGIDDHDMARELSSLIGQHDVAVTSFSYNGGHGGGGNVSSQREAIYNEGELRRIPAGKALLLATSHPPTIIDLNPWYQTARAKELTADITSFEADLASRATTAQTKANQ